MAGLNVELLEQSFQAVAPKGEDLVAHFYASLFLRYPEVRPLFANTTPQAQQAKLLASLAAIVGGLRSQEKLVGYLQELGRRHAQYGAQPAHYDVVGAVLLDTLASFAGSAWTPEVKQAWVDAYGVVKQVMIEAAAQARAA